MNRDMGEIIRNQKPRTLPPSATVQEACKMMHTHRVGAVLVTYPNNTLAGIFTGRDAVRVLADSSGPGDVMLEQVMTTSVATLKPGAKAIDALRLMHDGGFRHLPVVHEGQVVGIVSRGDFRGLEQDRLDEETGMWERMR